MKEEDDDPKQKPEVPLHVRLQIRCLELCTHLISHPSREIRLKVIGLVRELSKNVAEHTDQFLPMVHKLWSPICQRFSSDDLVVKARIVCALFDLCVLSGDFLAARFVQEFLPRLCQFMREQSKQSISSATRNPTYVYSAAFKLQCTVLANIDKICVVIQITQLELELVLDAIVFTCLDRRQPKRLQSLALNALRHCALVDPDVVWLSLLRVIPFEANSVAFYQDFERAQAAFKVASMRMFTPKVNFEFNDEVLVSLFSLFNKI